MRIVVIPREDGEYRDGNACYELLEVPENSKVATLKEIVNDESADAYADGKKWKKEKKER